jgi:aminoglycoside/choline kinase family phosphotransferase
MAAVVPPPPDAALVADSLRSKLPFRVDLVKLAPLAGDASNRRYFRLEVAGGPPHTLVLMQLASPEAFKKSEEAVSAGAPAVTELPFVNILRHLEKANVAVPALHYYDEKTGLLYLEDLGDMTLADASGHGAGPDTPEFYYQAVDALAHLHLNASFPADPHCIAFGRAFDVPLLMWEFDHFIEYGIEKRGDLTLPPQDRDTLRREMGKIATLLAEQPRVFTHRDYHSRNLMVQDNRLRVIDFQDALMGPATYDLASLLRDSYLFLPEELVDELVVRYLDAMAKAGAALDRVKFTRLFDLTSIQRNLKAAGRFVYILLEKNNDRYIQYIPRTLSYVKTNLGRYRNLKTLETVLARHVPELA